MVIARGDGRDPAGQPGDVDGGKSVLPSPIARIPSPALDAARGGQGAGVGTARGDGDHAAGQPGDVHRGRAVRCRAVAQLAVAVRPPALDPARRGQGAGVVLARGDGGHAAGEATNVHRGPAIRVVPSPSWPLELMPPALEAAARVVRAQVWHPPAATATTPPAARTRPTGDAAVGGRAVAQLAAVGSTPST